MNARLITIFFLLSIVLLNNPTNIGKSVNIDITDLKIHQNQEINLTQISIINENVGMKDVKIVDHVAYMLGDNGFYSFNVSDPLQPNLLYSYSEEGYLGHSLSVIGDYVVTASCGLGIVVFNITDREKPNEIGNFFGGGCIDEVTTDGVNIYATGYNRGLLIISLEQPFFPVMLGTFQANLGTAW